MLLPFIRGLLLAGDGDAVYFGFSRRTDKAADTLLDKLLSEPDFRIQAGALRVAGLLRREDIINRFEMQYVRQPNVEIMKAVDDARALVNRDY